MTRRLDFNDVHSDVESIAPIIPAHECTTPQKSFSIPFCGSSYTPDCDDTLKPNIGMTFTDVESAKEFYMRYAHRVGFSVRVGQHKVVDGVVLYKRFFCAKEGFRDGKNMKSSSKRKRYLRVGAGGFENVGFLKRDLQNYHSALRVLIKSSDAQMFDDQLSRKSLANPGFYFDYVVDDEGRLVHVFWADATCRKNYAHFGDLVLGVGSRESKGIVSRECCKTRMRRERKISGFHASARHANKLCYMIHVIAQTEHHNSDTRWGFRHSILSLMIEISISCSRVLILNEMCLIRHGKLECRNDLEHFSSMLVAKCAIFLI